MNTSTYKVLLMIIDGWGLTNEPLYSAMAHAHTPFLDKLFLQYPNSQLEASGTAVGLPMGQMGNSEVGHMHIGAGRIIPQDLTRINQAIEHKTLQHNEALLTAISYAKIHQKKIHLMGLLSDGGIHAHIDHLKALCEVIARHEVSNVFIHAFTDGRDTPPYSASRFLSEITHHIAHTNIQLGSIMGRYYAMDRNQRWERTQIAYNALVRGSAKITYNWEAALAEAYQGGSSDEFLQPMLMANRGVNDNRLATITPGDVVICFNFRTDRTRQLTTVLTQKDMMDYQMNRINLHYITLTVYDDRFQHVIPLFPKLIIHDSIGEIISKHGKRQLRIAETEKYPHVTYFFSGGQEVPFSGEERILYPSPKIATYDLSPAMSAYQITAGLLPILAEKRFDFICLNFANADMVGHTGIWQAAVKACEVLDECVHKVLETANSNGYITCIVSDHGNIECMRTETGMAYTAHTINPVPFLLIAPFLNSNIQLRKGTLIDVAPTILQLMGLPLSQAMEGNSLILSS